MSEQGAEQKHTAVPGRTGRPLPDWKLEALAAIVLVGAVAWHLAPMYTPPFATGAEIGSDNYRSHDWLEVARLYTPPLGPDFADSVLEDPLLAGTLVNRTGDTALVLAWMESMGDIDARRDAILADLRAQVAETGETVHYAGMGVIYAALNQASTVDSQVFIGASYLVIVGLLLVLFRRVGPVVLTMTVVGLAAIWLMGLYGATGHDINMVTMVLPTLMLIIGVSDCIHFLNRAVEQPPGGTRWERARARRRHVQQPVL